jgi:hypothetical protein
MTFIYKGLLVLLLVANLHRTSYAVVKLKQLSINVKKDSMFLHKRAIVDGIRYTAFNKKTDNTKFYIKDQNGKIVFTGRDKTGIQGIKFIDFNGDGYKDIILDLMVEDSGAQDLILYDPKSKKFVFSGDCSNAKKVINTKYYYNYEDCCMGRDWSSVLLYIANSKLIPEGFIKYNDGDGLYFYKFHSKNKILIKKWLVRIDGDTPDTTGKHIDFDLGTYWKNHWHKFAN